MTRKESLLVVMTLASVVSFLVATSNVWAQDQAFHQWFSEIWRSAAERPIMDGRYLRCSISNDFAPTTERLAQMRASAKAHPQSPDSLALPDYELAASGHPRVQIVSIWTIGGEWRMNLDFGGPTGSFFDMCVRTGSMWSLAPGSMTKVDPSRHVSPQFDYRLREEAVRGDLWSFATGGLSLWRAERFEYPELTLAGGSWQGSAIAKPGPIGRAVLHLKGTWDAAARRGTIDEVAWEDRDHPERSDRLVISNWGEMSGWGRWGGFTIRLYGADGTIHRTHRLEESGSLDTTSFENISKMPRPGASDAVRPSNVITSVIDMTVADATMSAYAPGTDVASAVAPLDPKHRDIYLQLRRNGWALAGLVVTLVGVLYFIKRVRGRRLGDSRQ
jgi:hypothetical protein